MAQTVLLWILRSQTMSGRSLRNLSFLTFTIKCHFDPLWLSALGRVWFFFFFFSFGKKIIEEKITEDKRYNEELSSFFFFLLSHLFIKTIALYPPNTIYKCSVNSTSAAIISCLPTRALRSSDITQSEQEIRFDGTTCVRVTRARRRRRQRLWCGTCGLSCQSLREEGKKNVHMIKVGLSNQLKK